jgi:alpha-1,3-rhamnosyl/mannosyltransferase
MAAPGQRLRVGVDAATWANDRGFGRFTRELMRALISRDEGFEYTLVFDRPPREAMPAGAKLLSAATRRALNESHEGDSSRSILDLLRMAWVVHKANFDVFFFPAVYSYFPILGRKPCVVCYHDCTAERLPQYLFPKKINHRLWQVKTALALRQTSRAMTVTETSARDIESIFKIPRSRIDVVTEAADAVFQVLPPTVGTEARAKFSIADGDDLLITLGGMNAHKNILGLLRAMPQIVAKRPHVRLVVVGDTSGRGFWDNVPELMAFVAAHPPLEKHVQFSGYLDDDEVVRLLNGAAALVFPSLWEGFGLPAVEAMQCGVPVLSSNRGSLPEVVGDAGMFFEPEDPADIARAVLAFLEDSGRRARLGEAALARAANFSWERAAELAEASFRKAAKL